MSSVSFAHDPPSLHSLLDIQNYIKSDSLLQEYGFENWLSLSEQLGESWYNIGRFEEALKIATDSYVDARKVSSTIYQLRFSVLAVKAKESLNMSKSRMSMESIENMLIIKSCIESLSRHEFFVPGLVLKSILEILNLYSFSPVIAARDNCFEVFSNWSPISSSLRLMEKMEKSLHPSSTLVLRTALIEKRLQILVQKAIYDRMEGRIFESFSNFKSTIRPFFSKTVLELSRSSIVMEALFQEAQSAFCSSRILQKDQSDEAIEQAKVNIDCISDIISATGCFDLPFAFRALSLMLLIIASNKEDSEVKNKTIARISTSLTSCVSILGGTGAQFGDFNYQGLKGLKRITIDEKNDLLEDVLLVYKSKISTAAPPMTTTAGLRKNSKSAYMNSSSMILNNNVGGLDPLPPGKQQEDIHLKLLTKETISSYISETLVGARYCGPIHLEDSQTSESWKRAIRLLKVLSRSFPSKFNPCLAGMWRTNFSDDSNLSKMSAKVPNSLLWVPVQMGKEERTLLIIKNSRPSSATGVGSAKDSPSSTTSNGSAGGAGKNKSAKGSSASVSGGSKAPTAPSSASNKEKNNAASSSASSSSTSNSSTSQASKQSIQVYFAEFSETWIRSAANSLEYIRSSSGREFEVDQRNNATLEFCTVFFKALVRKIDKWGVRSVGLTRSPPCFCSL